ncbi:MAG: hypothetical protein AB7F94_14435, partial [Nitrospira sp.]
MLVALLVFVVCFFPPIISHAQQLDHEADLQNLITLAQQKHLSDQREWQRLLHYRKGLFGG